MGMWSGSSRGALLSLLSAQGFAAQLNALGVVADAVEDGIGHGRVADQVAPAVHRIRPPTTALPKRAGV